MRERVWVRRTEEPRGGRRKGFSPINMWSLNVILGKNAATFFSVWHLKKVLASAPLHTLGKHMQLFAGELWLWEPQPTCGQARPAGVLILWKQPSTSHWWELACEFSKPLTYQEVDLCEPVSLYQLPDDERESPPVAIVASCLMTHFCRPPSLSCHTSLSSTGISWNQLPKGLLEQDPFWGKPNPGEHHS